MEYEDALENLYNLRRAGIRLRLSHTRALLKKLGDPHTKFRSVLVGGTNGKGSVCAFISSVLMEAGFKTGLYTSPHLIDFTERFIVDGEQIGKSKLASLFEQLVPVVDEMGLDSSLGEPSFFEVVTAMAFKYFAEENVDFAVVEVGLGGRLDATNVLTPEVSAITNIGLDHTELLGDNLDEIAREKAGIIKEGTHLVTAETKIEAKQVIKDDCMEKGARMHTIGEGIILSKTGPQTFDLEGIRTHRNLSLGLNGGFQQTNAAIAVTVLDALNEKGIEISFQAIRLGLQKVTWPGRYEKIPGKPEVILDCAHNPAGAKTLVDSLRQDYGNKKHVFMLGVSDYKDVDGIITELSPLMADAVVAASTHPHAMKPVELARKLKICGVTAHTAGTIPEALGKARELSGENGLIVVAGSIFFVGETRKHVTAK